MSTPRKKFLIALERLSNAAEQLLAAEGSDNVQLFQRIDQLLTDMVHAAGTNTNLYGILFDDDKKCTSLLRILAVITRYRAVCEPEKPQQQLLLTGHMVMRFIVYACFNTLEQRQENFRMVCALMRLQVLHCASPHFAAAWEYLRQGLETLEAELEAPYQRGEQPQITAVALQGLAVQGFAAATCTVAVFDAVESLIELAMAPQVASTTGWPQQYIVCLATSLRDSHVLEHAARWFVMAMRFLTIVITRLEQLNDASDQAEANNSTSLNATTRKRTIESWLHARRELVGRSMALCERCYDLQKFCASAAEVEGGDPHRHQVFGSNTYAAIREVLSGPCLQHFVLTLGISVLIQGDRGTLYGLPLELCTSFRGAFEPLQREHLPPSLRGTCRGMVLSISPLEAMLFFLELHSTPGTPLPGWRTACHVALRMARLGLLSFTTWADVEASTKGQHSTITAFFEPEDGRVRHLLPWRPSFRLWLNALIQTRKIQSGHHVGTGDRWQAIATKRWKLSIQAVDEYLRRSDALKDVVELFEPLLVPPRDEVVLQDQAAVSPEVAVALRAGFLGCLERLLRRAGKLPKGGEAAVLARVVPSGEACPLFCSLVMHAGPLHARSLTCTLGKVIRRTLRQYPGSNHNASSSDRLGGGYLILVAKLLLHHGPAQLLAAAATSSAASTSGPKKGHKGDCGTPVAASANDSCCAGAEASMGHIGARAEAPSVQQLRLLMSQVVYAWLDVVPEILRRFNTLEVYDQSALGRISLYITVRCIQLLLLPVSNGFRDQHWDDLSQERLTSTAASADAVTAGVVSEAMAATEAAGAFMDTKPSCSAGTSGKCNTASRAPAGERSGTELALALNWRLPAMEGINPVALLGAALHDLKGLNKFVCIQHNELQGRKSVSHEVLTFNDDAPVLIAEAMCRTALAFPAAVRSAAVMTKAANTADATATATTAAVATATTAAAAAPPVSSIGNSAAGRVQVQQGRGRGARKRSIFSGSQQMDADENVDASSASTYCPSHWNPRRVRVLAACLRATKGSQQQQRQQLAAAVEALAEQLDLWAEDRGVEEDAITDGPLLGAVQQLLPPPRAEDALVARMLLSPDELRKELMNRFCADPNCSNLDMDADIDQPLEECRHCGQFLCGVCHSEHRRQNDKQNVSAAGGNGKGRKGRRC